MANIGSKTYSNVFYKARCQASTHNERLSSRESTADIMLIDRGRLYRIESGIVNPYPEEIHMMADLYNAPELINGYCHNMCPLGNDVPEICMEDLDRISLKAISSFRKIAETREIILNITEDGVIEESEQDDLQTVIRNLEELEIVAQNLKVWVKKNL